MLAGIGSMQALVPPQMMLIEAVGAIESLWLKRAMIPRSRASGQGPRSLASATDAASASRLILRNIFMFQDFASAPSNGMPSACRNEWKPITPSPTERSRSAA
jgi:hypothetical protein